MTGSRPDATGGTRQLPSGTVSLLFSDIEGSTLLLARLGSHYLDVLDGHRRIMRQAWRNHRGTEMGTEGDSFFVAFPTAGEAVAAAAEAQRGLEHHAWPDGQSLRVRIGIHTGSPEVHDGDYWGMDVHRAARIAGSAHGGQVVMSASTAELVRTELPDVVLRDLGRHHLKDIPAPEHLYQLTVEGLPLEFPPLRSLGAGSSLPHPATPLVGRQAEVEELTGILRSPDNRLVTLAGAGGSGKTRLAIAVAHRLVTRFADGVFFVPLAAVSSAEVMWSSMAEALDVPVRERPPERLLVWLSSRSVMLVLDNLEQIAGADEVVERLLAAGPGLSVVATSRRPLGLPAERRHAVAPLPLPDEDTLDAAERSDAVRLFVQRAVNVQPGFRLTVQNVHDVVGICRRLDGLPLAIELSASRIRLLSPGALLGRLDRALDIAGPNQVAPTRQRTLRETIAWSYELLTPRQRSFLRRLSVFAGGADLDAVAAVTSGSVLPPTEDPLDDVAELVDASLVIVGEGMDGEPRLHLLRTIRDFGRDELAEAGEAVATRSAHLEHYAGLARQLQELRAIRHVAALSAAETELDNFREALGWVAPARGGDGPRGELATGLRLCAALGWVWLTGGYVGEGRSWHERLVERAGGAPSPELAACLAGLASLLIAQADFPRARALARQGVTMVRPMQDPAALGFALSVLGTAELQLGELEAARETLVESIEAHRRGADQGRLGKALGNLAGVEEELGHLDEAEKLILEALTVLDGLGDAHEAAVQRQNLAHLLAVAGRVEEADDVARRLVDTVLRLHSPSLTMAFANTYMNILLRRGDPVRAARLFGAEEEMHHRLAIPNPFQDEELAEATAMVADTMSADEWNRERDLGRTLSVEDLLTQLGPDQPGEAVPRPVGTTQAGSAPSASTRSGA